MSDTSKADNSANTWLINAQARVSTDRLRFWGELSTLPQRWDKTGRDIYVPVTASGVLRRLTQGAVPLRSPIYRMVTALTGVTGYWPLEDGSATLQASNAVSGGRAASTSGTTFGATSTLPGAESVAQLTAVTSKLIGALPSHADTGTAMFVLYHKFPATLPVGVAYFASVTTTGTARRCDIGISTGGYTFTFYDPTGTVCRPRWSGSGRSAPPRGCGGL
jgi:hypothetical protein